MDVYNEALQKIDEELNLLRISIANGQADNFANYKQLVGRIQGVEWSREVLKTILKKMYEGEEE
tara:strand:+ start:781 stop:972 length:192 start_codon:yes stop_codon:yes gene_type:complete